MDESLVGVAAKVLDIETSEVITHWKFVPEISGYYI